MKTERALPGSSTPRRVAASNTAPARTFRLIVALAGCLALFATAQPGTTASASNRAQTVARATDVVKLWKPDQHLYVKGNVGVSAEALDRLEQWLDAQATNWVVVLAENADGESFTDSEGGTFTGIDAVEHALGKGLMNQTAFGELTHPRTKERNAAFFILFLKERKLSYYGSDAQDRRGLGEDNWAGNLDRPAVTAMRSGGRVVDAVKDTINSVNTRLEGRITSEFRAREQRAAAELAERTRALEAARAALESARSEYNLLEARSGELSRQYGSLTGDLARPGLAGYRAELQSAAAALEQGDAAGARRLAESARARMQLLVRAIEQHPADGKLLLELETKLDRERSRDYAPQAKSQLAAAKEALAAARHEYQRGDSSYTTLLRNASAAVAATSVAISSAERMAEQQRLLLILTLALVAASLAALAIWLNRRRLPARREAQDLLKLWETALSEKTTAVFGLLDSRASVVGTDASEAEQRYTGETLRIGRQIIQDVDELLIMSSCAGRVLQQAQHLAQPPLVWTRMGNLLFAGRYQRATRLLRDHPIEFRPEEGLELVVRGARTDRDRLLGGLDSYQPFTMSFNELMEAFNQRARRAVAAIDEMHSSLLKAPEKLMDIRKTIESIQASEAEIADSASTDGLFAVPSLFGELVPNAKTALAKALQSAVSDPVGALRADGARAAQQVEDAKGLVLLVKQAREGNVEHSPGPESSILTVGECAASLEKTGVNGDWLRLELEQLSQRADRAALSAVEGPAADEIIALRESLVTVKARARHAVELDQMRRDEAQARIAQSTAAIAVARKEIAAQLNTKPGEVLREQGIDPTDAVTQAQHQAEAAFAALERGDLEAAQNAIQAAKDFTLQADEIVAASRMAFAEHQQAVDARQAQARQLADAIPIHARLLSEIQNGYAPSVLALTAGDPAHPNANGTIADNIQEAETHLRAAREHIGSAEKSHAEARLLESAELLRQAEAVMETGMYRLREIAEKQARLAATEVANAKMLNKLDQRARECARLAEEPTTMPAAMSAFEQANGLFLAAQAAQQATVRDPFDIAAQLDRTQQALDSVADQARCDRDIYEQAGRSLSAAASQLAEAERIAARAAGDSVPDSPAILQARGDVGKFAEALRLARQRYGQPHENWHAIDEEANGICNRAAAAAATVRGELDRAQAAVAELAAAASAVRNAGSWRGGFGVLIMGTPGNDFLSQARHDLERGMYEQARRLAENARGMAERAIAQAIAEENRHRQAEEERRERERRQRQAAEAARRQSHSRSSNWGGHSSFGSRSSSWGSAGSGVGRSSFSRGSGVGRSSW